MSITTSQRLNGDQISAGLPGGAGFRADGSPLESTGSKVLTPIGTTDATLQTAVTAAAAAFVDRPAIRASLTSKAQAAIAANNTYIALASPTAAQTTAQVQRLSRECNALIRLLLSSLDADDA